MSKKSSKSKKNLTEGDLKAPASEIYPILDTDLVMDYLENADDLQGS
jgi:hypothetical protein